MNLKDLKELSLKELYTKYREIIVYLIVGVLTTVVNWVVYFICVRTFLDPKNALQLQIAVLIAWVAGVLFAYVTNRKYVFQSKNPEILKEFIAFVLSRVATYLMEVFLMWLLVTIMGMNDLIAKIIANVVVIIGNYVFSKLLVFSKKDKKDSGNLDLDR
ncbi:MAG: GtrA family protein [Lachnospiraceae bacterium]|nr:GtrA family protein [Lachnospiraceae bacterium]